MPYPLGRGVRLEVQNATGTTKTISAISQADPGVATSTAHSLADGVVGYITGISGMVQLEGQVVRIDAPNTNDFALQKVKTTNYPAMTGTCVFTPISTWHTVGNATQVSIGGGDSDEADQTVLLDDIRQIQTGLLAAQSVTINTFSDFESSAMIKIAQAAVDQEALVFRETFKSGVVRIFRGTPSLPGEDVAVGQTATGTFTVKVIGRVYFLPAVA